MSAQSSHDRLVGELSSWIADNLLNGDPGYILKDVPGVNADKKPPMVSGFVPDVYVPSIHGSRLVLGEAETGASLESKHTRMQLEAFLRYCACCDNAVLVLAVPWDLVGLARGIMRQLKMTQGAGGVTTIVLAKLPG